MTATLARLGATLGSNHRNKLNDYLDPVRHVEQQAQPSEPRGDESFDELPDRPVEIQTLEDHAKLVSDARR